MHSQPPPVLAQVPVANWPVINHIHCELHDQLRQPGLLCSVNVNVVHFPGPSPKCLGLQKTSGGVIVRLWLVLLEKIELVTRDRAGGVRGDRVRVAQMERFLQGNTLG